MHVATSLHFYIIRFRGTYVFDLALCLVTSPDSEYFNTNINLPANKIKTKRQL
jgi:hypothetical protein